MNLQAAHKQLEALAGATPSKAGRVHLNLDGPIARIVLDNPDAGNAMTARMMADLSGAVCRLTTWDGVAVILEANGGKHFCAGGHLGEVVSSLMEPGAAATMCAAMTCVLDSLLALPCLSVAALDGVAMGGGAELCTACDFRVARRETSIHFVHGNLGVAPGWGGTRRLTAHIGRRMAIRVLCSAAPVSAPEALAMGLVDQVVEGSAVALAEAFLGPMVQNPPSVTRGLKRQVMAAGSGPGENLEREVFLELWGGPAHQRAINRWTSRERT